MVKRMLCAGAALACWAAVGVAQETPGQERREQRQERREDRRDDRQPVQQQPVQQQPVPVQQQPAAQGEVRYENTRQSGQTYKAKAVIGSKVSIQGGLAV